MPRSARMAALLFLVCAAAQAKTHTSSLAWSALPPDLVGRTVKVELAQGRSQSGVVESVDAAGITLRQRKGSRSIPKADVSALSWTTRKPPKRAILGAAIGAVPGALLTWLAVVWDRNEGGIHGARNTGIAVGVLAGGAIVGALAGRSADADRYVITITGP